MGRHDGTGRVNCGRCEKCLRTAGGLLLAGIDPTVVGLPIQPDAYDLWTRKLTDGLGLSRHTLPFWQENRAAVTAQTPRPTDPAAARFLAALATSPVRLADTGVNRYEYLRNYWTRRHNVRLRELRAAVDATTQRTRRRVAAVVRGSSPQTL